MAAHTPGPWNIIEYSGAPPEIRIEYQQDGGSWPLAILETVGATLDTDAIDDVTRANARLIAAAPDLLVACEALVHATKLGDSALGGVAVTLAEAAIAEATAEEPDGMREP